MKRLACRVMVAVAGMAVLGMTATLAGAQTHPATYTLNDVMQAPFASDSGGAGEARSRHEGRLRRDADSQLPADRMIQSASDRPPGSLKRMK